MTLSQATGSKHGRLVAEAINASRFIDDIPARGLNHTSLASVLQAATALTDYRKKIVASGSINVMWTQYNEVQLGDYTSVAIAADCVRAVVPSQWQPLLMLGWTDWIFALDAKDRGVAEHWETADWRTTGNWSRIGTTNGWSVASAMRQWEGQHKGQNYSGAGWFRISFSGALLMSDPANPVPPDGNDTMVAISGACGYISGWLNGAPMVGRTLPVSPSEPTRLNIPAGALRLTGANILALRFETKQKVCTDNAGLMGRVFIASRKDARELVE